MADTTQLFIDHNDGTFEWAKSSAGQGSQFWRGDGTLGVGAQGFQGSQGSAGSNGSQGAQGSQGDGVTTNQTLASLGFTASNGGSVLSTGQVTGYFTCPYAGTISAWNIVVDTGTVTIKCWKIATGTAKPTSSNSINTSGVALSTGTAIHSTTTSDFTTTTVAANDIFAFNIEAVSGVTQMTFNLQITKS